MISFSSPFLFNRSSAGWKPALPGRHFKGRSFPRFRSGRAVGWVCLLFCTFYGAPTCLSDEPQRDPRGPGTIRMAERLQKLAAQANPVNNIFLNSERVKLLQAEVARTTEPSQLQTMRFS